MLASAALALPIAAAAQTDDAAIPSYASPPAPSNEDVVRGQILAIDGAYNLRVRDDRGFIDAIELHQGTIINPTGLRLAPGMSVTIRGINRGNALDANQIDTPYQTYGAIPAYPYAYPAGSFAYPYGYGYGYGYGFLPRVSVGFGVGPAYGYGWGGGRGHWH